MSRQDAAFEGVQRASEENRFNPIKDYLSALRWDACIVSTRGSPHTSEFTDTPLHRAQGRLVLLAAVRRAFDPGCKFDTVLALEVPREAANRQSSSAGMCRAADAVRVFFGQHDLDKDERAQMELNVRRLVL